MARYSKPLRTTYKGKLYTPHDLSGMSRGEMSRAYTVLRKSANARLEKLAPYKRKGYEIAKAEFPTARGMSKEHLEEKTQEASNFLRNALSDVENLRQYEKDMISALHEHGLDFVNPGNLKRFGDFMERTRMKNLDKVYGSSRMADVFNEMERLKFKSKDIRRDFAFWVEHLEELQEAELPEGFDRRRRLSSEDWAEELGIDL